MSAFSVAISPNFSAGRMREDPGTKEEYMPILHAVRGGDHAMIATLLENARAYGHGMEPYLSENYNRGYTPLHISVTLPYPWCMKAILKGARKVYPEVQEFFTEENSDCPHPSLGPYFEKDDSGATPLHYAVGSYNRGGHRSGTVVQLLLSEKFGAHACLTGNCIGDTPLSTAVILCNRALVEQLVMAKDKNGNPIGKQALMVPDKNGCLPHQYYSSEEDTSLTVHGTSTEAKGISDYLEELYLCQSSSGAFTKRAM